MTTGSASHVDELLPQLKQKLGESVAEQTSESTLRKYLLWKPNVGRAADRIKGLIKWRKENPKLFEPPLLASKDPTLQRVLESEVVISPEGCVDKKGNTVLIGRLRYNDFSDGRTPVDCIRMLLYTMDRALERESSQQNGVIIFHDMKDVSPNNIHISVPKMLFSAIIGHFPLKIAGAYCLNAPPFFKLMFPVISLMMPTKIRQRFHFVDNIEEMYNVIDKDNLLEEHGGNLKHDQKQWLANHMERETNGSFDSLFI